MKKVISNIDFEFIFQISFSIILFGYLLLFGGHSDKLANSFFVNTINLLLVTSYSIFVLWNSKRQVFTEIDGYLMSFLLFTAVSSIFSINFWQSINEYSIWGFYFLTYMTLIHFVHKGWSKENLINVLILVGSTFLIYKLIVAILWIYEWVNLTGSVSQSILIQSVSSSNQTSAFAYIIFSLSLSFYIKSNWNNLFYLISLLSSVFVIIVSTSRGGLIGLFACLIIVIFGDFLKTSSFFLNNIEKFWKKAALGIGALFLAIGFVAWRIISVQRSGIEYRFRFWSSAIGEFLQSPLIGSGLFSMGNNLYKNPLIQPLETQFHTHAHSLYFNLLGELGILGLLSFLLLLFNTMNNLWILHFQKDSYMYLGAIGALGGILAHGLVDTMYVEPRITFLVTIILGITLSSSKFRNFKVKKLISASSIGFTIIFLISGWLIISQRYIYENAIDMGNSNELNHAYDELGRLIKYKPKYALANQQNGIVASKIAILPGNDTHDWLSKSIGDFEEAARYDPSWPVNYANLGVLYASQQNYDKALDLMEKAYNLAPKSALINLNYAVIAENAGKSELARKHYWKVIDYKKSWVGGPFWKKTDLRRLISKQYANMRWVFNGPELHEAQYLELISKGKHSRRIHLGLAEIYLSQDDIMAAKRELEIADMIGGNVGEEYLSILWYKAEIEFRSGNEEKAFQLADRAFQGWEKQSINGPGTYDAIRYGENYFRRPDFKDDLVPQFTIAPMPSLWINREIKVASWYLEFGKVDLAEELLYGVLSKDPENKEAQALITQIGN